MTAHPWPFTVTVLAPDAGWLTSNKRLHRMQEAKIQAQWRAAGAWAVRQHRAPRLEFAHVMAYLRFHDERRRDPLNWADTVKPVIDGFVDGGLLPDDDRHHLEGPDLRIGLRLPRTEPLRIEFLVTPLERITAA